MGASADSSSSKAEEVPSDDQSQKELALGDSSGASVEELQNLAGGADIKVLHTFLY